MIRSSLHEPPGERPLAPRPEEPGRGQLGQHRHRRCSRRPTSAGRAPGGAGPPGGRRGPGEAPRAASAAGTAARRSTSWPASSRSIPKIARATSVRPEPTKPASPTISPRRSSNETSEKTPAAGQALGAEDDVADLGLLLREERVERAPDHQADDLALRKLGGRPRRDVPPVAQDRDRVGERRDLLEPVADEDDRDAALAQPRARSRRGSSTSCGESAAVGSSMISSRALDESALAISSSCRSATPSPRTGVSGPKSTPSSSRMPRRSERIARQSTVSQRPRGCRPAKTFSATVRSGKTVGSWYIATMPEPVRRPAGRRSAAARRRRGSRPSSGLDDAGEDLHERRLAGAVLADERVHRAGLDREADVRRAPGRRRSSSRLRAARRGAAARVIADTRR